MPHLKMHRLSFAKMRKRPTSDIWQIWPISYIVLTIYDRQNSQSPFPLKERQPGWVEWPMYPCKIEHRYTLLEGALWRHALLLFKFYFICSKWKKDYDDDGRNKNFPSWHRVVDNDMGRNRNKRRWRRHRRWHNVVVGDDDGDDDDIDDDGDECANRFLCLHKKT